MNSGCGQGVLKGMLFTGQTLRLSTVCYLGCARLALRNESRSVMPVSAPQTAGAGERLHDKLARPEATTHWNLAKLHGICDGMRGAEALTQP